jgi:excisionase family DNA binding protein
MSTARTQPKLNGVYLRVGEIAGMLGVNVKTVRRWIDTGRLEGHRMPENVNQQQERRVHHEVLRDFLVKAGYKRTVRDLDDKVKREKAAPVKEVTS